MQIPTPTIWLPAPIRGRGFLALATALLVLTGCARGEGPEVRTGVAPPPVTPPAGARRTAEELMPPPDRTTQDAAPGAADSVAREIADLAIAGAQARPVEAVSLLGDSLRPAELSALARSTQERLLAEARADWERDQTAAALIWVGRRQAYLGRYGDAIRTFTDGIARFPDDPRFYRHRAHRQLTIRRTAAAVADFERAADLIAGRPDEIEPDGMPNARGIPTSTLQSNIWYHLGLARYLQRDFTGALVAYDSAMRVSTNPDMRVATAYWRYLTLRRLGRADEARAAIAFVTPELDVIENEAYFRLLQLYKGDLALAQVAPSGAEALDDVSTAYGIGVWHLLEGRPDEATRTFQRIVEGGNWAAFAYIAAEAELAAR